jgi:hypothetical protein
MEFRWIDQRSFHVQLASSWDFSSNPTYGCDFHPIVQSIPPSAQNLCSGNAARLVWSSYWSSKFPFSNNTKVFLPLTSVSQLLQSNYCIYISTIYCKNQIDFCITHHSIGYTKYRVIMNNLPFLEYNENWVSRKPTNNTLDYLQHGLNIPGW